MGVTNWLINNLIFGNWGQKLEYFCGFNLLMFTCLVMGVTNVCNDFNL